MITEDYVSFETAKLLKDKGFDCGCRTHYNITNGELSYEKYEVEQSGCEIHNAILAPTLQMVMKWLREERKINIEIFTYWSIQEKAVYGNRIVSIEQAANIFKEIDIAYNTYEEACEEAIKYCLENLI